MQHESMKFIILLLAGLSPAHSAGDISLILDAAATLM
jgi:hypothetical protein